MTDTVLLVGSDAPEVRALGEAFERLGYIVLSATNADAAEVAFARRPPDLVILDPHLPDARRLELCERLRPPGGAVLLLACSTAALERVVAAPRSDQGRPGRNGMQRRHLPQTVAEVARAHIERTLQFHGGNRTRAAQELGISRATLINKIKAYGL